MTTPNQEIEKLAEEIVRRHDLECGPVLDMDWLEGRIKEALLTIHDEAIEKAAVKIEAFGNPIEKVVLMQTETIADHIRTLKHSPKEEAGG